MEKYNIFVISDNQTFAKNFISKILLLRKTDLIGSCGYLEAKNELQNLSPDIVFFHIKDYQDTKKILEFKEIKSLEKSVFIMLSEFEDSDLLCSAFDFGIDDFMSVNVDETALIMRVMWALKKKRASDLANRNSDILSFLNVTEQNTGFFQKTHTQKVFEKEYAKISENHEKSIVMVISADILCKSKLPVTELGKIVKNVIRSNDIAGFAPDEKVYLILPNTDETGAKKLFERISERLDGVTVSATAAENFCAMFSELEKILNKQLARALTTSEKFIFVPSDFETSSKTISSQKDKLLTKASILKRLEKVVTPTFFKMQAIYEPKFFDTKISQINSEKEMSFIVSGAFLSLKISIKFEDFPSIMVLIKNVLRGSSSTEKHYFDIDELTTERLENIMQTELDVYRTNLYEDEEEIL